MPAPDEHAEVEAEIAALMRTGFGFEPHRLDPPPIEPALTFDRPGTPAAPRRFLGWVAAAAVVVLGLGAFLVWPSDDPTREAPRVEQQVAPLEILPGARGTDDELAALQQGAARVPDSGTEGKASTAPTLRTLGWDAASGAAPVLDEDAATTSAGADPRLPGGPDALPRTHAGLASALVTRVADCREDDASCAALGLSDLARRYVLEPRFTERLLLALGTFDGLEYLGDARDRLGRAVVVVGTPSGASGQRVQLLFAPGTGRFLGDETVAGDGPGERVVAVHYVLGPEVAEK